MYTFITSSSLPYAHGSKQIHHDTNSEPELDPTLNYPDLSHWLSSLDADPICSHDNQNYSVYAMAFQDEGLLCLDDIMAINADELKATCSSLNGGTACCLVRWAIADGQGLLGMVKNQRAKRARQV